MLKKVINILLLATFIVFFIFLTSFYISEENIKKINKSRLNYSDKLTYNMQGIPLLKNDTNNIIEYKTDIEADKKKKKYNLFWKLIEN